MAAASQESSFDSSFSDDGKAHICQNDGFYTYSHVMQSNNKIVCVGSGILSPGTYTELFRINTDGTLDLSFGNGGYISAPFQNPPFQDSGQAYYFFL